MKIGLDLRMAGGGSGISRYIYELSKQILEVDKKNEYVLFFKDAGQSDEYKNLGHKVVVTGIPHYSFAEQFKLPGILKKENLDLVHFPHFNVPLFYKQPFVVTIHDLTHTKYPGKNKFRVLHRLAYNLTIAHAVKKSRKVIAISNSVKSEIVEYFKISADKVQVIHEGTSPEFSMIDKQLAEKEVSRRFSINKPYILFVGVWRRYKNLPALAGAFDTLREKGLDYELILAGEPDPFYPEIKKEVFDIKHKASVKALGRVTDEDLNFIYNAASLFVLPSFSEGFGLTPLEAAATGIPVICSDIPVLREVMGSGADFFDPYNAGNMADVMERILTNHQKAEELANAGLRRTQHFSWEKAAEETINLYQTAI